MKNGWIKLHRKSLDHWLYNENRPHTKREAWEDILLLCNHTKKKILIGNKLIECDKGQVIRSLNSWSEYFNWHKSKVRRFFKLLEKENMIRNENVKKTTRITVLKYDVYQHERNVNDTHLTRKRHASDTQVTPNKNVKNDKNDNNERKYIRKDFLKTFNRWLKYKKDKKQTYKNEDSIKAAYNNLYKLSNGNAKTASEIVEQSLANNWAGLFAVKDSEKYGNTADENYSYK